MLHMLDLSFKIYTAGTRLKELSQKESFTITMYIKDTSTETLAVDILSIYISHMGGGISRK